jgi:hypothetical protein
MTRRTNRLVAVAVYVASMAAGCQFRPNPLFSPATADLAPIAPPPLPPDDLASPPTMDLGSPATDLASPCTHVSASFANDPSSRWSIMGDATVDAGGLQLTSLGYNVAGSAFYDVAIPSDAFDATFTFRMGDGSGADGLAFVVARATAASALAPYGNGAFNEGYGLGYLGMDGLAVELDTFMDVGNGDPNGNHVALVRTSDGAHLLFGTPGSLLRSTASRTAHVRVTSTHVTVEVDGDRTLDADLPSGLAIPAGPVFFGFTSASSALNDHHGVRDLTLIVGPAATCF